MTNTVDKVKTLATTWDGVKKRRLSADGALLELPINLNGQSKVSLRFEDTQPRLHASGIFDVGNAAKTGPGPYTQRHLLASTPGPTQNPLLDLSHSYYDLPERLVQNFRSMGIRSMYPWQSSCLLGRGNLAGQRSLVYTAPTGGGKSLVADVLMLKRVLEGRRAMLVLPYVALIQEKLRWLRRVVEGVARKVDETLAPKFPPLLDHSSIRVAGFYGGSKTRDSWLDVDIAVCTIEKANMLVNSAITDSTTQDLGIVVIDELHMLDDDHRGYIIEVLAAKLLSLELDLQLIGMSATLANTELLARWLNAKFYESNYKPVPLEEHLVCENEIYDLPDSWGSLSQADSKTLHVSRARLQPQKMSL